MPDEIDIQFPINHALLEETSKIKQERVLIRERLAKVESKKNEVSPSVYQKVKQDYTAKLNEITNAFLEKKTDIDKELATLYETRKKITENLKQHKDALEELKFRHSLGEYDDSKFSELSKQGIEKIGKFEKILAAVNTNIERYEAIFADEEGIAEAKESVSTPISATIEESDYMVAPEEGDYFTPEAASASITKKTLASGQPRIIITEGDLAGHEYKLKKETTIGRANTNMIVLKDAKVSRQHAVIKQTGHEFMIIDLNSSNGVLVNHERIKEHVLSDGDQIQIGDHTMQLKL